MKKIKFRFLLPLIYVGMSIVSLVISPPKLGLFVLFLINYPAISLIMVKNGEYVEILAGNYSLNTNDLDVFLVIIIPIISLIFYFVSGWVVDKIILKRK